MLSTALPSPNADHRSEDNLAAQQVLICQPTDKLQPRWTGPYIVCNTSMAVKVCGLPHWIHQTKLRYTLLSPTLGGGPRSSLNHSPTH